MLPENISNCIGRNLHLLNNHPICLIKQRIVNILLDTLHFEIFDDINPIVSTQQNFDDLLIPSDHVSRRVSDTFYLDNSTVLRTHTSAHQTTFLKQGVEKFIVVGDVYRRDSVDKFHYPVFHQMEAVALFDSRDDALSALNNIIDKLIASLFPGATYKWIDSYFPFTQPSYEVEIEWDNKLVEVLGCGLIHQDILKNCGINKHGFAFGLGLERLAMILYNIPDIRLFWTTDTRFLSQFDNGDTLFKPYSNQPVCYKDISFWISPTYEENHFFEICRSMSNDLIEDITLKDEFTKHGKTSKCYRISYRSIDKTLTNADMDKIQSGIRDALEQTLGVTLR